MNTQRGVAVVLVMLIVSFMTTVGLGLALIVMMEGRAAANVRDSVAMLYAADAALELAARDLAQIEDWDAALAGNARGSIVDGPPTGVRALTRSISIDLGAIGNELTCARPSACTEAQITSSTRERPWGANNARWQLFAYGPVRNFAHFARPVPGYVTVWIADDGREEDGDAVRDGTEGTAGHGVIRIRVDAYGPQGIRRPIEAELARLCIDAARPCARGIRVQSWREVRNSIP
jgi:hypothetical protein